MQMNYAPQSVASSFHSSPTVIPARQPSASLSPTVTSNQPFQIKFSHLLSNFMQVAMVAISVHKIEEVLFLLLTIYV